MSVRFPFSFLLREPRPRRAVRWLGLLGLVSSLLGAQPTLAQYAPPPKLWDKVYGGNAQDHLQAVVPTADGGCLLAGRSSSGIFGTRTQASQGGSDYWMVKLDAQGSVQWDQRFGSPEEDYLQDVQPTADGGYLLGGYSVASVRGGDKSQDGRGGHDFWYIKTDATGFKLWEYTLGGDNGDRLYDIEETGDGAYLLAGSSARGGYGSDEFRLFRISFNGVLEWQKTYGGSDDDVLQVVRRTPDQGFLLAGTSRSPVSGDKTQPSRGGSDYWVVKVTASGVLEWERTYGGPGEDNLSALQLTPDGGFVLGGTSESGIGGEKTQASRGGQDYWVVKATATGAVEWDRRFGGAQDDNLTALQLVPGGLLLGGSSWSGVSGDKAQPGWGYDDYWLLRLDLQGRLQWERRYGGDDMDHLRALALQADGSVLVGGESISFAVGDKTQNNLGFVNFWLLKLAAQPLLASQDPEWAAGLTVFPIPAHTSLQVQLPPVARPSAATLSLTDAIGRPVLRRTLTLGPGHVGQEALPVAQLPTGVYWLQVRVDGQHPVTRQVLIH